MSNSRLLQWKTAGAFLLSSAVLSALALTGCRQTLPTTTAGPYAGVTIRIDAPAGADVFRAEGAAWAASRGAALAVRAGGTDGDVGVVAPADLPAAVSAGGVEPLPEEMTSRAGTYAYDSLLAGYARRLCVVADKPVAVPLLGEAPVCVWRADVFDDPARKEAFRAWAAKRGAAGAALAGPASWAEFALVAEFFAENHPSGKAGPSLPALPADAAGLDRLFHQVAAGYVRRGVREDAEPAAGREGDLFSYEYDHKTGEPLIASGGFVEALAVLGRLAACAEGGGAAEDALLGGRAVLAVVDAPMLAKLQRSAALRDKLGVAAVPGAVRDKNINRVPYVGGAGLLAFVRASSPNKAAAFDFLADLTGKARSAEIAFTPAHGGGPTRADHLLRDRWDVFGLDARRTRDLRDALTRTLAQSGIRNPVYALRIPDAKRHREILADEIRKGLAAKADPAAVLGKVAARWKEIDAAGGPGRIRREYRLSLGLLPDG